MRRKSGPPLLGHFRGRKAATWDLRVGHTDRAISPDLLAGHLQVPRFDLQLLAFLLGHWFSKLRKPQPRQCMHKMLKRNAVRAHCIEKLSFVNNIFASVFSSTRSIEQALSS